MDFADATLVRLAQRERVTSVFTNDRDGVDTCRIDGRHPVQIEPARR